MRKLIAILILILTGCGLGVPDHFPSAENQMVFPEDSRNELESFEPTPDEIGRFENELLSYLEDLTKNGTGYEQNVLDEVHPLEYSLGWFKRRYFGRVNAGGEREMFVELVFVRCGGSGEWKTIDYPNEDNYGCWWSVEYDIEKNEIDKVNYP